MNLRLVTAAVQLLLLPSADAQFNNPPGVDIWCGKAYRAGNASFNPGGQFIEPAQSGVPLLSFKVTPRMSLYLEDENVGSVLVNASISEYVGVPYYAASTDPEGANGTQPLSVQFFLDGSKPLLNGSVPVKMGAVMEIPINFSGLAARLEPYNITAVASDFQNATYDASMQISRLPLRQDNGTATRIDNRYGSTAVRKAAEGEWKPIFPYTYYVQWSLYWYANLSTLGDFSSMGYNVIHIVPTGDLGDTPFPWDELEPYLDRAAELGLYFQYDVRWDYSNLMTMIDQVQRLKSHPSILLWYTGDEPDGKSNPINSTRIAYETIRSMDPYHPVSLALNCYDFHYSDYASGAEIILSDVYPISTNTSWSTVYETPCNATYGCCGCDDCNGYFEDISDRLDNFARFDDLLGWQKTHWGAPQAFGNETFWTRYPTPAEEVVMNMLSINHGAKGIVMWDFPTTPGILDITNKLAAVLTAQEVSAFFVGQPLTETLFVEGGSRIDASAWVSDEEVLLSIVNLNYDDVSGTISVQLPEDVEVGSPPKGLWGQANWTGGGRIVSTDGLLGLEASLLIFERS